MRYLKLKNTYAKLTHPFYIVDSKYRLFNFLETILINKGEPIPSMVPGGNAINCGLQL